VAGQDLAAAVAGGRMHAEDANVAFGERDRLEPGTAEALAACFARFEHETGENYYGPLTAVRRDARGAVEAAVDDRRFAGFAARAGQPGFENRREKD
jgi:hypothetical protein